MPSTPSTRLTLLDRFRRRLHGGWNAAPPAAAAASSSATGRQVSLGEDTLSSASSLTNEPTSSSSYVGDELDLDYREDEPQEEEHYPDEDWLTADRSAAQLTVDRNSSAASSSRSGIHFTARTCATPTPSSVGSGIQRSVRLATAAPSYGSGIQFYAGPATAASSYGSGIQFYAGPATAASSYSGIQFTVPVRPSSVASGVQFYAGPATAASSYSGIQFTVPVRPSSVASGVQFYAGPATAASSYSGIQFTVPVRPSSVASGVQFYVGPATAASSYGSGIQSSAAPVTAASSYGSGIQSSAAPATAASSYGSGIQFSAGPATAASSYGSGIQFFAPQVMEPSQEEYTPNTLTEEYGKMLTLESLKHNSSNCLTCQVSWRNGEASLYCNECGGYALLRPCPTCSGQCGATWDRNITKSHDKALAAFSGVCLFQPDKGRCQHITRLIPAAAADSRLLGSRQPPSAADMSDQQPADQPQTRD